MPLTLEENTARYQIKSYQPGVIKINEQLYTNSLLLSPTTLIEHWRPQTVKELTKEDFADILQLHPTILLIGTGNEHEILPIELYGHLINEHIGVEIMNTSAACRTFNALSAENRHVMAALLIR